MNRSRILKQYVLSFLVFQALDFVWLTKVSPTFYQSHIPHLLAPEPNLFAAAAFYLLFIAGLVFFSVHPSSMHFHSRSAFFRGAFFGLVTYGTFDLTSQAVFRDWPTLVTVVDLAWGTFLTGVTCFLVSALTRTREESKS